MGSSHVAWKFYFRRSPCRAYPSPLLSPCSPRSWSQWYRQPLCLLWSCRLYHQHGLTCPLPVPSPCCLSWSSSIFFFFSPCRLIFRWPHPDVQSQHRCQSDHVKGTRCCQWWGSRALLPRRRQAKQLLLVSQVVKKLKSPPAKRKPADTGPLKREEGEPSPALKKLLVKHMIGKVVFKKK